MKIRKFKISLFLNRLIVIFALLLFIKSEEIVHEIKEIADENFSKIQFESDKNTIYHFFKYNVSSIPQSQIGELSFEFEQVNDLSKSNKIICNFFPMETSDKDLIANIKLLDEEDSCCNGEFNDFGIYKGIIKYNLSKRKLGILLISEGKQNFSARVYIGAKESERPDEGASNVITIEDTEKSVILSLPKIYSAENKINVQLQLCNGDEITYSNLNSNTEEEISSGVLLNTDKLFFYTIVDTSYETKVKFIGDTDDKIFLKYSHLYGYQIKSFQNYRVTFNQNNNMISIIKPIIDEEFNFTILIGKKGVFYSYNLCTFSELDKSEYYKLGDFVITLNSVTNNPINYYINFKSFLYKEGDEFDILVYAVQLNNTKFEILYDIISGVVGTINNEIIKINTFIPPKYDYVTEVFKQNNNNNYLFYDFVRVPSGNIVSLRIKEINLGGLKIQKVVCSLFSRYLTDDEMYLLIHDVYNTNKNMCIGDISTDKNEYNGLINTLDLMSSAKTRLFLMIIYDNNEEEIVKENEDILFNITLRINGIKIDSSHSEYNEDDDLTLIPYVLDLEQFGQFEIIEAVLLFSNTSEMKIFYFEDIYTMVQLICGNFMLLYTDSYTIDTKYNKASTLFLIANSTSTLDEKFILKATFFEDRDNIQYLENSNGRLLNVPITLSINSCVKPFYFIFNYYTPEEDRILHIENIFGEINKVKYSNQFNEDNWQDIIDNMEVVEGNEYYIGKQSKYHIDLIEISCYSPSLLNIYYTDPIYQKKTNLNVNDISILNLYPSTSETLTFKLGLSGEFFYGFNIFEQNNSPNIVIGFEDDESSIDKNGIYIKKTDVNYFLLIISNRKLTGNIPTKIIFKFGYNITAFTKIENDIYNLQEKDRTSNLFAYKFPSGEDRLNYTKVNLTVNTSFENVKVCYTVNLGLFIEPSSQNCFIVSKEYPYSFTILNPYIMYKNYYIDEQFKEMYISFKTDDINQNITIVPTLSKYGTNYRNIEGIGNSVFISDKEDSVILTNVENENKYLFVQIESCTLNTYIEYELKNAFNSSSLGENGSIQPNMKIFYLNTANINSDIELVLRGNNNFQTYVKYVSLYDKYQPIIYDIEIKYDDINSILYFTQPIEGEEFNYTIYIDKLGVLSGKNYSLCSTLELNELSNYTIKLNSREKNESIFLDFNKSELKEYESFDVFILAEQVNNGKLVIMSDISSYNFTNNDEKEEEIEEEEIEEEEIEEEIEEEEEEKEEEYIDPEEGDNNKNNKLKTYMIIGFTGLGLIILIIIIVLYIYIRRKKNQSLVQNIADTNIGKIEDTMLSDIDK